MLNSKGALAVMKNSRWNEAQEFNQRLLKLERTETRFQIWLNIKRYHDHKNANKLANDAVKKVRNRS